MKPDAKYAISEENKPLFNLKILQWARECNHSPSQPTWIRLDQYNLIGDQFSVSLTQPTVVRHIFSANVRKNMLCFWCSAPNRGVSMRSNKQRCLLKFQNFQSRGISAYHLFSDFLPNNFYQELSLFWFYKYKILTFLVLTPEPKNSMFFSLRRRVNCLNRLLTGHCCELTTCI